MRNALAFLGMVSMLFIACLLALSCNRSNLTSATDAVGDVVSVVNGSLPPKGLPPVKLPNVAVPFQWETFAGFTAFGLYHPGQTLEDIYALYASAMSRGWNTARICSETEYWDGTPSYLPRKPRDRNRLQELLETIATIPGAQVLLIGDCTLKRQVPLAEARKWASTVANVAGKFDNVAIETHNEFANCRGRDDWGGKRDYCPGKRDVADHIGIYRSAGISFVTADDRLGPGDFKVGGDLGFRLENIGAVPADFHAQRDKVLGTDSPWDPSEHQIRRLQARNGYVLFSETVALGDVSGSCKGLRTCDIQRIQSFINACHNAGECGFVFHSEALLGGEEPGQWPNSRK